MLRKAEVFLLRSLNSLSLLLGDNYYTQQSTLLVTKRPSSSKGYKSAEEAEQTSTIELHTTRGASLTMVRASTQQTVDRIVGTAAVIGLSVVFIRWLSNAAFSSTETKNERRKKYTGVPWWWPALAMRGWRKRKNRANNSNDETVKDEDGQEVENGGEYYEHQGSCHCGSINFVLRGPRRLRAVDSPGKIRYPHFPTLANNFQLVSGENNMRFYYEDDNKSNDDSSSITFENAGEERNDADAKEASGAHVFCGNCGVHVFHADRSTGELQVNANCLDGMEAAKLVYREESSSGLSSITNTINQQQGKALPLRSQSSLSSTREVEDANDFLEQSARNSTIETVSENEPFLGSASRFLETLDDSRSTSNHVPRKESISSDPTQPESYSIAEGDESSMGSSSITGASMPFMYQSSLSVASGGVASMHDTRMDRTGLPPLGPSRLTSTDRSVKTLPAFLGDRPGGVGSSWSVASMESTDLDGADAGKTRTISPRMRDQMKKYMGRHMHSEKGK